jgi:phenylacetic acid degradation operon negative regulatory protein
MTPTARNLILELLGANAPQELPVRTLITAGALFGISSNSVRVALVRLSSDGLLEASGRGAYVLSESAAGLAREVSSWRGAEERIRAWHGSYVAVHSAPLGRTDRGALKRRARALSMLGFAELERGFHLRPDNLAGGVDAVRARLQVLGLESDAAVFVAGSFAPQVEARARALWNTKALNASYKKSRTQIERWLARAHALDADTAARESFLLGSRAIKQIVYDPLLPAPFVDVDERHGFFVAARALDHEGRRIWRRFRDSS